MTRFFAILFGIAFIFAGVVGFLPTFKLDDLLFGYFTATPMHNVIHIATGVIAIMAATSHRLARLYFQLFGLIYTALAVWGFWTNGDVIIMHLTLADSVFHITVGVVALLVGFGMSKEG